jgi:hypothetical protein
MGVTGGPNIVDDGLVFCLDAASNKAYPGSGTSSTELIGRNVGTLTNGVGLSSDGGGSFEFDGTNDYITFGDLELITSTFSISAWFRASSTQNDPSYPTIVSKDAAGTFGNWIMTGPSNGYYIRFGYYGSDGQKELSNTSYSDLTSNEWVHYCGTWDGSSNLYLYRNGIQIKSTTTATGTLVTNNNPLLIGNRSATSGYFTGKIAIVQIYNKELTSSEVIQNYNSKKSRFI